MVISLKLIASCSKQAVSPIKSNKLFAIIIAAVQLKNKMRVFINQPYDLKKCNHYAGYSYIW
jgi:hypothetical protein